MENKLHIKNMVCDRCIMVVRNEIERLGVTPSSVTLGEVILEAPLSSEQLERVKSVLTPLGFELIDDRRTKIVEQVKNIIVELVHHNNDHLRVNLSDHLASKLNLDYSYISNLFSEVENTTIERYHIAQRIERVKELLVYDELSLSEIAHQLNYSSVAHLSAQFKQITGLTPSHFKRVKDSKQRKTLDKV